MLAPRRKSSTGDGGGLDGGGNSGSRPSGMESYYASLPEVSYVYRLQPQYSTVAMDREATLRPCKRGSGSRASW